MEIKSPNGTIIYNDTEEHFKNGFLRLMSMDREVFDKLLALSEKSINKDISSKLEEGFKLLYPTIYSKDINYQIDLGPQHEIGYILYPSIAENSNFGIACSLDNSIGWLVNHNGEKYVRVIDPPIYEENYFEGDSSTAGGYGEYAAQAAWRLEKSARQVAELSEITGLKNGRVLDVGSGYGYFRKALNDAGFKHEGIEISKHANIVCKNIYGFNSYEGTVSDHLNKFLNAFDVVVLSDVIEHVADPVALLKDIYTMVKPGGFVIIKTPNLDCPEAKIFGSHYHSLKREHLVYFTSKSLIKTAALAGFSPFNIFTTSHLLVGFLGDAEVKRLAHEHQGSDIVAYFNKD